MTKSVNVFKSIINSLVDEKCFPLIDIHKQFVGSTDTATDKLIEGAGDSLRDSRSRNLLRQFDYQKDQNNQTAKKLNIGFLILLAAENNPLYDKAKVFFKKSLNSNEYNTVARFYLNAVEQIYTEIDSVCKNDYDFNNRLIKLKTFLADTYNVKNIDKTIDHIWDVFFPEGVGLLQDPVKSADPPKNSGSIGANAAMVFCDA